MVGCVGPLPIFEPNNNRKDICHARSRSIQCDPPNILFSVAENHYHGFMHIVMFNVLANGLVIVGICVLMGALIQIRQLVAQLPSGTLRSRWYALTASIVLFIAGYASYTVEYWNRHGAWLDLIVPGVFFFGACFVWLTTSLSLNTAIDVRRVTLLERESVTDPLMGIYNRRYLDRRLEEEFARSRRYGLPLSVLLLDIDHFKLVNDTYGHQAGDLVLKHLGELLLLDIRDSDIVARYGGEEILVMTPNTTMSSAAVLAEHLRERIESHEIVLSSEINKRQQIRVTVSIGVAGVSQIITDTQKLVKGADDALYRAKQAGRNRVMISDGNMPKATAPAS